MIKFTPNRENEEKEILYNLVNSKKKTDTSKLVLNDFDLPKVIRKSLTSIAIGWNEELTRLKIYIKEDSDLCKPFFEVLDIIYYIKSLEDNGLVSIIPITNIAERSMRSYFLYDSDKYKYDEDTGLFLEKMGRFKLTFFGNTQEYEVTGMSAIPTKIDVNLDVITLIDRYSRSIIYPLPLLEDYVTDFKTVEQRRFDKQISDSQTKFDSQMSDTKEKFGVQIEKANAQIKWAKYSMLIAFIAAILSLAGLMLAIVLPHYAETEIKQEQIDGIKNTILDSKTVIPERIEVFSEDTIKVLSINVKKESPIPSPL